MQKRVNTKMQKLSAVALPQRLKVLRDTYTQAQMAKKLNINQQTYARWELGDRQPKLQDLCAIALHFGVSADWLLGLSDTMSGNANTVHGNCANCPLMRAATKVVQKKDV